MIEIYYMNSKKRRLDLTGGSFKMLSVSNLFDYEWTYTTKGTSILNISSFNKRFVEKAISVVVSASTNEEYKEKITELMEIIDLDINVLTPGRLYVGKTYLECFFVASKKPKRYVNTKSTTIELSIVAENGNWIYEDKKSFSIVTGEKYNSDGLDFPTDYPFDYANDLVSQRIVNDNYASSDFEMIVYGPCISPEVSIGLHTYKVDARLYIGEYMVIDSRSKKVYKVKNNGEKVNLFHARGRDFYIFEKIPSGIMAVSWSGEFGFDITLLSERSEPVWT